MICIVCVIKDVTTGPTLPDPPRSQIFEDGYERYFPSYTENHRFCHASWLVYLVMCDLANLYRDFLVYSDLNILTC